MKKITAISLLFAVCTFTLTVAGCSHASTISTTDDDDDVTTGEATTYLFGSAQTSTDDSVIVVTTASEYDGTTGYGFSFDSTNEPTINAKNITSDKGFQFYVEVENKNYEVTVVTSTTTVISEWLSTITYKTDSAGNTATYTSTTPTGIERTVTANTESTFQVAVCDGVMNLKFTIGDSSSVSVSSVTYKPLTYNARTKPYLIAIGDSTAYNNSENMCSWGPCISNSYVTLPSEIGGFINCAMGGADAVTIYNGGVHNGTTFGITEALLNVHPGDYVTVNIGINNAASYTLDGSTQKSDSRAAQIPILENYCVEGIIQRGGIPVIATITPRGDTNLLYTTDTTVTTATSAGGKTYAAGETIPSGTWHNSRHDNTYNKNLLTIAENYDLDIIALGIYGEQYLTEQGATADNLLTTYFADANHYRRVLGEVFANYITESIVEMINGNYEYPYSDYVY